MPLSREFTLFEKNRGSSVNRGSFGRIGLLRVWAEMGRVGLDWDELSAGLKWAEIQAGLGRPGLGRTGLRSGPLLDWTDGGRLGRVAGRGSSCWTRTG
ncbi:hypothetical protein CRG98_038152 [Punica granatum]|uniref:Uncharacterized protein n=1 Tax=Punica granatum TaxID=22663 RepID=A0A2I0ICB6_PUNGR|nr:hypothetical protein CRG98_038152 [Punica granatum]